MNSNDIPSQGRYIVTLNTKEQEILLTKENGSDDEKQSKPSPAEPQKSKEKRHIEKSRCIVPMRAFRRS